MVGGRLHVVGAVVKSGAATAPLERPHELFTTPDRGTPDKKLKNTEILFTTPAGSLLQNLSE